MQSEGLRTIWGHLGAVKSVAFSPDGTPIASGFKAKTVKLWNASVNEANDVEEHLGPVTSIAFPSDGKYVISEDEDSVLAWDATTGAQIPDDDDIIHAQTNGLYKLDGEWIVGSNGEKACWVPSQYRGETQASYEDKLAIGTGYGRVVILRILPNET